MNKKLVVISIDAMGAADLTGALEKLPTLKQLIREGSHVKNVSPISPSLTYPSHTSIVTGVYPKTHGIVNNTKIQSERTSPDWFWFHKAVQVPTLYDLAYQQGLVTAAFLWPVTAKSRIDYNIAEIFPNRIWTNQVLISLQASSPWFLFEMNQKYGKLRRGIQQPYLDDFVTACAVDTIKRREPDLTLIHLVDLDSQRHTHGVHSEEAKGALKRQDKRVAEIIQASKAAGTFDETIFAVLGDHYQLDVTKQIRLNHEFCRQGWQSATKKKTTKKDWQVYAKSCDGSTYIYCEQTAAVTVDEIKVAIEQIEGIEQIYSTEEVVLAGGAPNCTFMVEAQQGYYFSDETAGPTVVDVRPEDIGLPNCYRAVHGYVATKNNYDTTIIFCGPGIKSGYKVNQAKLVDEAPTFAKILGLKPFPEEIDGQVIAAIFE